MSAVPYTFANASGQVPASELDVNFANVKAAVDTAGIVTTNAQPNITSVGTLTALSVTGNVTTGNVTSGNVLTGGRISATGNITGNYFIGNGSQLTGIVAVSTYGNSNVTTLLADFGSNTLSTTGNITSGNVLTDGLISSTGNIRGGNINTAGLVNAGELRVNQTANSWYISGNVISAPSGAQWNSSPATLDEYVTSADNGYINLQSLYANSNVASQVHLEHGLAQIIVDNGSEYIWAFDNTGNLTLPGNTFAVNYANGNPVTLGGSGSYGNANVVTLLADFGSNTISTTGNITSANISVLAGGVVSAAGNVRGGNINTAGLVNAGELRVNQTANSWYISGNVISAPSGAQWNSSPATLDEFITSAPDGYINLTSLYANSNVASQVHLEHGLAQIVVDNGTEYIWAFDNTGNLSAPGNVSAVGNITGANLNVGSGNVNVGNVVFALDNSKFNSAKWTLVETFANLNNYFSSGNSSVTMTQTFNYYATNYNEFMIKLAPVPAHNPYNNPIFYTNMALNSVSSGDVINIATTWNNSPGATDIEFAYVTWANLSTTGLVIHNPNTGAGDNPSTNLYIYAR